jgi:hypothetical protein
MRITAAENSRLRTGATANATVATSWRMGLLAGAALIVYGEYPGCDSGSARLSIVYK